MATTLNRKLVMGIRRAYRTALTASLEILAGIPPIELVAEKLEAEMWKSKAKKGQGYEGK